MAKTPEKKPDPDGIAANEVEFSEEETIKYWTQERRDQAQPVPLPKVDPPDRNQDPNSNCPSASDDAAGKAPEDPS